VNCGAEVFRTQQTGLNLGAPSDAPATVHSCSVEILFDKCVSVVLHVHKALLIWHVCAHVYDTVVAILTGCNI
jgi:hypothetical protein